MSVRLWAGLASVVFACLLAWVVYVSSGPPASLCPPSVFARKKRLEVTMRLENRP